MATQSANRMVRYLHGRAEQYYSVYGGRHVNYEDLYYLAKQMLDEERGETENPAIRPFLRTLKTDTLPLIKIGAEIRAGSGPYVPNVPYNFLDLLRETSHYIADIVWKQISKPKPATESVSHLNAIAKACNSGNVTSISTLCHDNHIESFLKQQGLVLSDGFSEQEAGVRYWKDDFSLDGNKVPFLKLHGSIDWFCLQPDDGNQYDRRIGVIPDDDLHHTRTDGGDLQWPTQGRPELLIGTFNKIQQYSSGIFRDLHYHFRSTLREASQIIICGYGFGDKGINSEIINWYDEEKGRRLIIIHPNSSNLKAAARGAIQKNWCTWINNGSLSFIEKNFKKVTVDEFLKLVSSNKISD